MINGRGRIVEDDKEAGGERRREMVLSVLVTDVRGRIVVDDKGAEGHQQQADNDKVIGCTSVAAEECDTETAEEQVRVWNVCRV